MPTCAASGRACAAIVAPSEDLAREIRARLPARLADRVHVIPTGVDVAGIRALAPDRPASGAGLAARRARGGLARTPGAGEEPRRCSSRRSPSRRRALRLAAAVIGGGPSEERLRARVARPDLAGRVHMTGGRAAARGPRAPARRGPVRVHVAHRDPGTRPGGGARRGAAGGGGRRARRRRVGPRRGRRDGRRPRAGRIAARVASRTRSSRWRIRPGGRRWRERARADADRFAVERRVGRGRGAVRAPAFGADGPAYGPLAVGWYGAPMLLRLVAVLAYPAHLLNRALAGPLARIGLRRVPGALVVGLALLALTASDGQRDARRVRCAAGAAARHDRRRGRRATSSPASGSSSTPSWSKARIVPTSRSARAAASRRRSSASTTWSPIRPPRIGRSSFDSPSRFRRSRRPAARSAWTARSPRTRSTCAP